MPACEPSFFRSNNAIKFISAPWGRTLASVVLGDGKYGSLDYRYCEHKIFLFVAHIPHPQLSHKLSPSRDLSKNS
ncbi:MAG: hypothetical protein EWV58_11235 [Microcystis aeruginosa Ma_MB_F_20061100_S19]|nr:MAG: hypothetical protein EWV58_11235 [Microcystis aeruginosa Ma_MB_F_20061100_S19]TRU15373.1 MAG: hypothetical protein EWV59_03715 [Microcystis aeruginosa Ma_MB_F_20061100_S19D]